MREPRATNAAATTATSRDTLAVTRVEWLVAGAWAAVMMAVTVAPIWHGYRQDTPEMHFLGFVGRGIDDYHAYLAWIRQAYDGHLLFRVMPTTEPHGRDIFLPLFLAIGWTARLLGVEPIHVFQAAQVSACGLLVVATYRFAAQFTPDWRARLLTMVMVTTSTGAGWMMTIARGTPMRERPIDLWRPVAGGLRMVTTADLPIPLGLALMLLAMAQAMRYFRTGRMRDSAIGGVFTLLLAAVHLYDIVVLYAVVGVWSLLAGRRYWLGAAVLLAPAVPYGLYAALTLLRDPVLAQLKWEMQVPTVEAHLIGWGLPAVLGVAALLTPAVWRENRCVSALLAWLVVGMLLAVLPISFRTKLILGLPVVWCLLAAMLLVRVLPKPHGAGSQRKMPTAVAVALVLAVVALCGVGSYRQFVRLLATNRARIERYYLPTTYLEAFEWLNRNAGSDDAVAAGLGVASMLPGRAGTPVFMGHFAQTIDVADKHLFVYRLIYGSEPLDPHSVRRVLERNGVRYLMFDRVSATGYGMRGRQPRLAPAVEPLFDKVFENADVTIWELRDFEPRAADQPWPGGNWMGQ